MKGLLSGRSVDFKVAAAAALLDVWENRSRQAGSNRSRLTKLPRRTNGKREFTSREAETSSSALSGCPSRKHGDLSQPGSIVPEAERQSPPQASGLE